jgi:phospholipase C
MIRAQLRYSLVFVTLALLTGCAGVPNSSTTPPQGSGSSNPPQPTASIAVSPSSIQIGQSATLTWQTTNATQVSIAGIGTVQPSGSQTVSPSSSTTYNLTATGAGGTQGASAQLSVTQPPPPTATVNHIIFLAEENRSFDHYFGKLNDYRSAPPFNLPREVDGLPDDCSSTNSDWTVQCSAMNKSPDKNGVPTTPIYAFHLKTSCIEGLSPDWIAAHWDFNISDPTSNTAAMDGFVTSAASAALAGGENDVQGIRAMGFYTADDLPYHYWLATQFATSDAWFNPAPTRTQPNRYYMMGGTSGGYAYPLVGNEPLIQSKTIFDLLQAAGVSWKIYTQLPSGYTYADAFAGFESRYASTGNIVADPTFSQFIADAQSGNLPAVAFLEKPDADEKPETTNNIQDGVAETSQLINAVMYGPSWKDSVFIFTFDEGGGLYDHVAPPTTNVPSPDGIQPVDICTSATDPRCTLATLTHTTPPYDPPGDFTRYGYRVPVVVISPFTKAHYVSHVTTDYTAWLKFVEKRFNLPSLTARDGSSNTSDMSDFFDFQNPPWTTPPANPPSDGGGSCYDGLP